MQLSVIAQEDLCATLFIIIYRDAMITNKDTSYCMYSQFSWFVQGVKTSYIMVFAVEGTTQLCRTSKLSINTKDEDNYCMKKPEKTWRGLGFDPGAAHSLGKCNKFSGRISSSDFPQFIPAYVIHTATTQYGSGSYLVEALTVLILCAHLCCEHPSSSFQKVYKACVCCKC